MIMNGKYLWNTQKQKSNIMFNTDKVTGIQVPDHPYRALIVVCSRSRKTNALLNLTHQQSDIDKIFLYAKDTYQLKY